MVPSRRMFPFSLQHILFMCVILSSIGRTVSLSETMKFSKRLTSKSFNSLAGFSIEQCLDACRARSRCQSVNYRHLLCELNDEGIGNDVSLLALESGYAYSQKANWTKTELHTDCSACTQTEMCVENNGAFSCTVTECARPATPDGFTLQGNNLRVGRTLRYACLNGYTESGSQSRITCQANGTWTARDFYCHSFVEVFSYTSGSSVDPNDCWSGTSSETGCFRHTEAFNNWDSVTTVKVVLTKSVGVTQEILFYAQGQNANQWFTRNNVQSGLWPKCDSGCNFQLSNSGTNTAFEMKKSPNKIFLTITQNGATWDVKYTQDCSASSLFEDDTNQRCYQMNLNTVDWSTAQAACQNTGWYLADIKFAQELTSIYDLAASMGYNGQSIWLGGNRLPTDGSLVWQDGTSVSSGIINWAPGQPDDDQNNEDCVEELFNDHENSWPAKSTNDRPCSAPYAYACEKDMSVLLTGTKLQVIAMISL